MSNFSFLVHEFTSLQNESKKAESNIYEDPEVSAIYARKALENSLRFVYTIDEDLDETLLNDSKTTLSNLLTNYEFKDIIPRELLDELHYIRKVGNLATHSTQKAITSKQSLYANKCLYKFQRWIVEVYSSYEVVGEYVEQKLKPQIKENKEELTEKKIDEEKLLEENQALLKKLEALQTALNQKDKVEQKEKKQRVIKLKDIDEKTTRENLIDIELLEAGFDISSFKTGKDIEYKLILEDGSFGYADYVLWDKDDTPLAVIEAKRASADITKGKHQATLYAKALKKKFQKDILVFVTNGRVIEYSNEYYPFRQIHSFFPKEELIRALAKLKALKQTKPSTLEVNENITNRRYQKRVIHSVLKTYESMQTKALLVMATGSGKTRVGTSISDILIRSSWATRVLFLADRKELVKQARNSFDNFLHETSVNLVLEKDLDNRLHFGTYETVHNLIRKGKYNSAFFDLIIVDEAHRTIYKKYKAIFEYFDSLILGLTATPADEIHRNTYEFFNTTNGEPTDTYTLSQAIDDGYLVNFKPYEIDLGIVKRGIKYEDLSDEEKEEFEDKFDEFEDVEDEQKNIESKEINDRIFNKQTNEKVLEYLFNYGLKIEDGNKIGKTIIFAKNQKHAKYIKEVFDLKYPKHKDYAEIIHSEISHVDSLIDNFKIPNRNPQIAISVDMLDTGIDVPEVLNLVFFKPIKSKIKFWQMIGRGTRLCPNLFGEGQDKEYFNIFDFCENFTFFDIKSEGIKSQANKSLKERLFLKRVKLIMSLEKGNFKEELIKIVKTQIDDINPKEYYVKKHKHLIEELQNTSLEYISDEVFTKLKTISEYIEDYNDFEVQRFQMLVLNAQESLIKEKDSKKDIEEIKQRIKVLKTKAENIKAIKEKEELINTILEGSLKLDNVENLEKVRVELQHLSNLSLGKKIEPVKTNFSDEIEAIKELNSKDYINKAEVKTEIQKVLDEYINSLYLLKELDKTPLVTKTDIDTIKQLVFDMQKNIEEKLEDKSEFAKLITQIINASSKELANKILDNFISQSSYSKKQIEVMNKIKNIVFDKQYINIETSVNNVYNLISNQNHPLSEVYDTLSEKEQDDLLDVFNLIKTIDYNKNNSNNTSYEPSFEELKVAQPKPEYN
jgi:type I restriction enzyme R subunit